MIRSNAFTIDVEDGISIAMRDYFNVNINPTTRVIINTEKILDLLAASRTQATFFIQGEIAKHFPELVKKISSAGHEVGVHSYSHTKYFLLSEKELRYEISYTKSLLEDITGRAVYGHRAPAFSINRSTEWALKVIQETGFVYDSSIIPANMSNYGWPGTPEWIHYTGDEDTSLIEVPLSVMKIFGKNFPVCGGGYLRHLPYFWTKYAFSEIEKIRPVIVYLHPYELDTEKYPDFFYEARSSISLLKRMPLYFFRLNKGTVYTKLSNLLHSFHFKPMVTVLDDHFNLQGHLN